MYTEEQLISAYMLGYKDGESNDILPFNGEAKPEWGSYILDYIPKSVALPEDDKLDIFEYLEEGIEDDVLSASDEDLIKYSEEMIARGEAFNEKEAESKNNNPNT